MHNGAQIAREKCVFNGAGSLWALLHGFRSAKVGLVERLDVTTEELEALLESVREPLGEVGYQKLRAAIRTLGYVTELLENRTATLERLRQLLCQSSTEKTARVLKQAGLEAGGKSPKPPGPEGTPEGNATYFFP